MQRGAFPTHRIVCGAKLGALLQPALSQDEEKQLEKLSHGCDRSCVSAPVASDGADNSLHFCLQVLKQGRTEELHVQQLLAAARWNLARLSDFDAGPSYRPFERMGSKVSSAITWDGSKTVKDPLSLPSGRRTEQFLRQLLVYETIVDQKKRGSITAGKEWELKSHSVKRLVDTSDEMKGMEGHDVLVRILDVVKAEYNG
ncbi:hypothetical protein MNV49_003553 [Pseudohyphozyma bogoriensis]|nr:hypothetical protein MNV49_003553 [Pseudohyphozyma bogoriensis]